MKIWRRGDADQPFSLTTGHRSATGLATDGVEYPPEILLYNEEELEKFRESEKLAKDSDTCAASAKVISELKKRGQVRQLMTMRPTFRADLANLREKFPNFSEVIDYVQCCAEIAWRTDKVLRFTPILLDGDGGVGKTMFIEALGNWMAHGFHRISVSSSQNGSDLAGSSAFFSNAKPGIPFTALVYSDYANPLIFLDEIDKNSTSTYDALGALYVLLEPSTAKNYKDLCYPLPIRADHILYASSSNDADNLHPALRSRFREFKIRITPEQPRKIANTIVGSTLRSLAPATDGITFSATAMDSLACLTPRRISQAVMEAIGKAFSDGASVIDHIPNAAPAKQRIGFLQ